MICGKGFLKTNNSKRLWEDSTKNNKESVRRFHEDLLVDSQLNSHPNGGCHDQAFITLELFLEKV